MKKNFVGLIVLFSLIFALTSCGVDDDEMEVAQELETVGEIETDDEIEAVDEVDEVVDVEYIRITPQAALEMMENEDVVVLDVRSAEEFEEGHIPGAVLLPYSEVRENAPNVISDKAQIILVYCRSGRRSEIAARTLIDLGYTRVYDFGGIIDWVGEIA